MQKTIRFPDELRAAIEAEAEVQDRSFSYLVLRACAERFLFEANPYSFADRPRREAEERAFEKAVVEPARPGVAPRRPPSPQGSELSGHLPTCRCPVCKPVKG